MNIVLFEPEIPHNVGAIGRSCHLTGARLHLIHPLGFFTGEKHIKRAGLDYWDKIDKAEYLDFGDFMQQNFLNQSPSKRMFLVETGGTRFYHEAKYQSGDYFVFGSETRGLPKQILEKHQDKIISIPMTSEGRSLNLSVSVGIILYEALRQTGFLSLL
jgi:tRNA (cytidine/uridine-2'-O-)-methyltransferase